MDISFLVLPYDSGHEGRRMGAGPARLLPVLEEKLSQAGHATTTTVVRIADALPAEINFAFTLYQALAGQVRVAREQQRFPLVLAGNCGAALGTVAGVGAPQAGVVWLDAHGDFNTPETSTSGFLDGMGLAILTGQCWRPLAASIPGFAPVSPTHVVHVGGRDFGNAEQAALLQTGVQVVAPGQITGSGSPALRAALTQLAAQVPECYLHVDLDVLDAEQVGRANTYAQPGGLTVEQVLGVVRAVQQHLRVTALTFASYDPLADTAGRVLAAAADIARQVVNGSAGE
ncbi:arginase family protein [Hymenobacter cellulosivorans]|uniref:Arginase family protein n=1 Tax=Hymenobacter cellulosivorans TaxID=2932249 RepID=A0ABY4F4L0_9BACT|nr:arginase family protein [Hymenobacter cellulosivorans]UOQ51594.1 arginase family protein [Hymenobacter cellulosivorans]